MTNIQPARVIGCLAIENSLPLIHKKNKKQGIIHQLKLLLHEPKNWSEPYA